MDLSQIVTISILIYAFGTLLFLISDNRRPQSTLAWMVAFLFAPGLGVLVYLFFGRDWKAFRRERRFLRQDLRATANAVLSPLLSAQDADIERLETRSDSHRKLMMLVRRNSRSALTTRNRVEVLQGGETFYGKMIEDIRAARKSIHLQYYIWRVDDFTKELSAILVEKVKEGVEVRLLYDPIGSSSLFRWKYICEMRNAGIAMAPTSPLYYLHTISYRNHRKITVIDGEIGYTGGMNMGKEHFETNNWRDTQVRIVGQGAALLQSVFVVDWYNAVRENLFGPNYFPESATKPPESEEDGVPVQILTSGPDSEWAAIRQLYSLMILSASHHVFIQSPYFILDSSIASALKTAALAGIDVRVMLASFEPKNQLPIWAANTYIAEVVRAGVKVFLYQKGFMHAKAISIDSSICSIGSANIDIRSFSINYELNAVLYSAPHAKELERAFYRDLEDCVEFDADEYRSRNRAIRFRDSAARLLSPLL